MTVSDTVWLIVMIYFIPSIIANIRRHKDAFAILALNLLLGWTFLVWVIALVWSFTSPQDNVVIIHNDSDSNIIASKREHSKREHKNRIAIFVLGLLLGWVFLFLVITLGVVIYSPQYNFVIMHK